MYYQLTDEFELGADIDKTWSFFSKAENLPKITPPWLNFRVTTATPIRPQLDSTIDYTIRWLGVPLCWRTRIIDWAPPRQFIDLQIRGPYTLWHHQHTFEQLRNGHTRCRDRVIYKIPGSLLGRMIHTLLVRQQLLAIFNYRQQQIAKLLAPVNAIEAPAIQAIRWTPSR